MYKRQTIGVQENIIHISKWHFVWNLFYKTWVKMIVKLYNFVVTENRMGNMSVDTMYEWWIRLLVMSLEHKLFCCPKRRCANACKWDTSLLWYTAVFTHILIRPLVFLGHSIDTAQINPTTKAPIPNTNKELPDTPSY